MFSPSSSKQRVLLFTWMEITPAAAEAEVAQVRWCSLTWYQNSCEGPLIGNNTLVALKREATLTLRQKETFRGPLSPHRIRLGISNFLLELLINVAKCDFWNDFQTLFLFLTDEVGQTSSQMKKFVSTGSYGLTTKQFSTPLIDVTMALK